MQEIFDLGGTLRTCAASETLAVLLPLLPTVGITRIANVTGLDSLQIPVALSIRPQAKHLAVSQGKGLSWELAQVSAIMESLENYHAENANPPDFLGTYHEFSSTHPLVEPQLFSSGLYSAPDITQWQLNWTKAWDLMHQQTAYLPHALINLDTTVPCAERHYFTISSNGLAAGNTKEEAICHGLYELIERDCIFRWIQLAPHKKEATQIILESVDCPVNRELIARIAYSKITMNLWDISNVLGIPTFHCVLQDPDLTRGSRLFSGTGTHLSKSIALSRAISEAAQSRLTWISGVRDDIFPEYYSLSPQLPQCSTKRSGKREFQACPTPTIPPSFSATIATLIQKLQNAGFEHMFVVDHTNPALQVPVIHMLIPGMHLHVTHR